MRSSSASASAPRDADDADFLRAVVGKPYDAVSAIEFMRVWEIANRALQSSASASAHRATAEKCKQIVIEEGPRAYPNIDRIVKRIDQLATALPEAPQPRHLVRRGLRPDGTYPLADDDEAPQSETPAGGPAKELLDDVHLMLREKGEWLAASYVEQHCGLGGLKATGAKFAAAPSRNGNEEKT